MNTQDDALWADVRSNLSRFITRRVDDPLAAEDILQESLLRMWSHVHQIQDEKRFWSWVYTIVRHQISDYYQHSRPDLELTETLPMEARDEDIQAEFAACLRPMLDSLPEKYRQAILQTEFEGRTLKEAADLLHISLPAIKSHVIRGRELLKGLVLQCCRIELDQRGHLINYESNCRPACKNARPCK